MKKIIKVLRLLKVKRYRQAMRLGVGASVEHSELIRSLKFNTFLDVGANVGQFSLLVRHEHPEVNIIAFEPLNDPSETYQKLFINDSKTTFHKTALGCKRENIEMHVSNRADSSSLLAISSLQTEQFPGTEEVGREDVIVAPMTDIVKPADLVGPVLLKIDVQGFELEVLKSAEDLLRFIDWVYVEASFKPLYEGQALAYELIDYLHSRNFILQGFYNALYDVKGIVMQADFLFEKIS